jgi:hypothetical protein
MIGATTSSRHALLGFRILQVASRVSAPVAPAASSAAGWGLLSSIMHLRPEDAPFRLAGRGLSMYGRTLHFVLVDY